MSCYAYGATFLLVLFLWWLISRFSSQEGAPGSTRLGGEPGPGGREGPQVDIEPQGERQVVALVVPLKRPVPAGLTVQVREHPTLPLEDQARDERAYYALVETPSGNPEALFEWSTAERREAVLTAWWRLRESFQLQEGQIRANFPVTRSDDPRIRNATWVLETLARDLESIPEEKVAEQPTPLDPAPVAQEASEPEPKPEPELEPEPEPEPAEEAEPEGAGPRPASELMAWLIADKSRSGDELKKGVADKWQGQRVEGEGTVSVSNRVFGKDFDFGVEGGHKVTLKVPESGQSGLMGPTIVLHLPDAPEGSLSFGRTVRFSGVVREYRPLTRNLLLEQGRVET